MFGLSLNAIGRPKIGTNRSGTLNLNFVNTDSLDSRITFTRTTTATRTNSSGLIESVAIDTPRFDYDPVTLEPKGLLVEEQRTNLLVRSEEFNEASWSKTNVTVTANSTTAPDGTITADTIDEGSVSALHRTQQAAVSFVSGLAYTVSIFVKNGDRDFVQIFLSPQFSTSDYANFDISTGVLGTVGGAAVATISSVGNGWYRCSVTATATSAGTSGPSIGLITSSTSARAETYLGTNKFLYIWGAQLEAGAAPSSYIPTVASQVTRAADLPVITGTNFSSWYRADEGTLFAEGGNNAGATSLGIASIDDGTINNRMTMRRASTSSLNSIGVASGVAQWNNNVGTWNSGQNNKAILAYKTDDVAFTVGAASVATDTSCLIPVVTTLRIGSEVSGAANPFNGHIRRISYYPRRLSNAELQAITA